MIRTEKTIAGIFAVAMLASVGTAAYITAAGRPSVRIARTSDDPRSPPAVSSTADACAPALRASMIPTPSDAPPTPTGSDVIGRFVLTNLARSECPPTTYPITVKDLSFAFVWVGLTPDAERRAGIANIDFVEYGGTSAIGTARPVSLRAAGRSRLVVVALRPTLSIAPGASREFALRASTTNIRGGQTAGDVRLQVLLERATIEPTYALIIGDTTYTPPPSINVTRDPISPSGVQVAGADRELARFQLAVEGFKEPIQLDTLRVRFAFRGSGRVNERVRDVALEFSDRPGRTAVLSIPADGTDVEFTGLAHVIAHPPGTPPLAFRVYADTSGMRARDTLRASIVGLTGITTESRRAVDQDPLEPQVHGNTLRY